MKVPVPVVGATHRTLAALRPAPGQRNRKQVHTNKGATYPCKHRLKQQEDAPSPWELPAFTWRSSGDRLHRDVLLGRRRHKVSRVDGCRSLVDSYSWGFIQSIGRLPAQLAGAVSSSVQAQAQC